MTDKSKAHCQFRRLKKWLQTKFRIISKHHGRREFQESRTNKSCPGAPHYACALTEDRTISEGSPGIHQHHTTFFTNVGAKCSLISYFPGPSPTTPRAGNPVSSSLPHHHSELSENAEGLPFKDLRPRAWLLGD